MGFKSHIFLKKFKSCPGSPGFGWAVTTTGLLLNPNWSSHRVLDPLPGRPGLISVAALLVLVI